MPKEVCEVRSYLTYRLRNVKDVKDRDGVLNSSGGTREKIDYIFINSFFSCLKYSKYKKKKKTNRVSERNIQRSREFDVPSTHYTSQRAIDTSRREVRGGDDRQRLLDF